MQSSHSDFPLGPHHSIWQHKAWIYPLDSRSKQAHSQDQGTGLQEFLSSHQLPTAHILVLALNFGFQGDYATLKATIVSLSFKSKHLLQRYYFWSNIYSLPSMPTYLAFTSDSFSDLSRFHISAFTPAMTAVLPMVSFSFICINPCTDQFYFQSNLHLPSLLYLQKTQTGGQSNFEVHTHCYKHVQYPESYWT